MSDARPVLAFPPPTTGPIPPSPDRTPFRPVTQPSPGRQGTRLTPQFGALRDALAGQRAELAESTTASDPELVAVFDLAGSVDTFMRAADGIEGLEFLADLQEDRAEPDDDFFFSADGEATEDSVPQSLYMIMTNAQAVAELVRLFELWQADPSVTFARGLNPLKSVFGLLRAIRRWGPEDRVRETGLLERWAEEVAVVGEQGAKRVEIELWYRADAASRNSAELEVTRVVTEMGGTVLSTSQHDAIAYHAVLAEIPTARVERVLREGPGAIDLLTTESVMMVSPSEQMAFPAAEPGEWSGGLRLDTKPSGHPRLALLDGLPLASHVTLDGRLIIDDPDDHTLLYATGQRCHGTAMSSLIVHGDLSSPGPPIGRPLYVRPILQPHAHFARSEVTPAGELLVDLVHRAFHRMFEGDGDAGAVAPSVRVVNLSIGDPARVFVRRLSPLARLLDWLAHRYNLLIVVSGGNQTSSPSVPAESLDDAQSAAASVTRSLYERARQRRLLSPAEAINVLTVGAQHMDGVDVELPDSVRDLIPAGAPASYSPVGFGFRRSVKPDLLLPGGRSIFRAPPPGTTGTVELEIAETIARGPGMCVASPGVGAELDAVSYTHGTSNATALATRTADRIFDALETFVPDDEDDATFPDAQYHPVLAKTLLVHAAGWHDMTADMRSMLGLSGQEVRRKLTTLLGYGPVHQDRVATAERRRVVLLGAGSIGKDQRHQYRFPLPPALSASTDWRRLTITLGWISPVNVRSQKYRMARLRFGAPVEDLALSPTEADTFAVVKGTVQHQVLEGASAVGFVDGTSLAIDVDCRVDAGTLPGPVRYGIAASLEVAASVQVDLHEQVRGRLRGQVRERARSQVQAT